MVLSPALTIKACSPGCEHVKKPVLVRDNVTDLQVFARLGIDSAKVEFCFTLGKKIYGSAVNRGI